MFASTVSQSPTTPAQRPPESNAAADRDREIAAQFEALLVRAALAPVAKAMGFYGDLVVDAASLRIARDLS